MADTSFFLIGCMKRQHAIILESIWETDSIVTYFPVQRTGLLTPLLTCFTLLSFSLFTWTNYSKSNSLSPFCLFGQNFSKSKFLFFSDKNILIPISISQKYSKTIPNSVLAKFQSYLIENILKQFPIMSFSTFSLLAYLFSTLAIGV